MRLPQVLGGFIEPNEPVWNRHGINTKNLIEQGDYPRATLDFREPNVVALLSFVGIEKFSEKLEVVPPEARKRLGRLAALTFGCLLPLFVFFGLRKLAGNGVASVASLLLVFDPLQIYASSFAVPAIFFSFCLLNAYVCLCQVEEEKKVVNYFVAGVWLGFAFLCNSLAVALVFALLMLRFQGIEGEKGSSSPSWGDLSLLVVSSSLLFFFWPKMYLKRPDALERLEYPSRLGELLYHTGVFLGEALFLSALVFGVISVLVLTFLKSKPLVARFFGALLVLFSLVFVLPIGAENLLRYWKFSGGYQVATLASGRSDYGLVTALFSQTPEWVLALFLVGFFWTFIRIFKGKVEVYIALAVFLLLGLFLVSLGSDSVTLSGIVATIPFAYILAAKAICSLGARMGQVISACLILGLCSLQFFNTLSWLELSVSEPDSFLQAEEVPASLVYQLPVYYNKLSGGETEAIKRGAKLTRSGQDDLLKFLVFESERKSAPLVVSTDDFSLESLRINASEMFGAKGERIVFSSFDEQPWADYLILGSDSILTKKSSRFGRLHSHLGNAKSKSFDFSPGVRLIENLRRELPFDLEDLEKRSRTGRLQSYRDDVSLAAKNGSKDFIRALPVWDEKNWLYEEEYFRVPKGGYEIEFYLSTEAGELADKSKLTELAVRVELLGCSRYITLGELSEKPDGSLSLSCEATEEDSQAGIRVWWYGKHATRFAGFSLDKKE